jgi:hypothetical protein
VSRREALAVLVLAGCGRAQTTTEGTTGGRSLAATAMPAATALTSASVALEQIDPDEEYLQHAVLAQLKPQRGPGVRSGVYTAALGGTRTATAEPATTAAPIAWKAPLAFYRLARALGMHVVPIAVVRAVALDDLAVALSAEPDARAFLGDLRVQNDGMVDVLLATPASPSVGSPWGARGRPFDASADRDVAALDVWAASPAPVPGEDGALLRDYVEMLVLDYLAANVARRTAMRAGSALVLADNGSAFPPHADRPTLDRLLRRLRAVARFPRGLRDALSLFDRSKAAAVVTAGGFEAWLLAPRTVVELDERRAALLTLVEARIAERGAPAVLAL